MKVAVLVDGAFLIKRLPKLIRNFEWDAEKTAKHIVWYCRQHVEHDDDGAELYRLFYYDCPPPEKKLHTPIDGKVIDYAKESKSLFRKELLLALRKRRKVALRMGYLSNHGSWQPKDEVLKKLLSGAMKWEDLTDNDFWYPFRQKGVDSRIAVDISSLSLKQQVQRIVLIAGDSDFVPASKLARREGIDFILDPLHNHINPDLHEHIDGCHSKINKSSS